MKLKSLKTTAKTKLSSNSKNVQLLIIDEMSTIGAFILHSVNYRINEPLNYESGTIFENLNCLFDGDILQLPPFKKTARDGEMFFEEINESMIKAQFSATIRSRSSFIDFNFTPFI